MALRHTIMRPTGAALRLRRAPSALTLRQTPTSSFSTKGFAMPTPRLPKLSDNQKFLAGVAAKLAGAGLAGSFLLQPFFGSAEDFYDYRFITEKDPDDLAGFYGSEDFMELFCVLPFMGTLMMRGGTFDDEGTVHTAGLPGEMLVSMEFSDEEDEEGVTSWFNKRENFKDVFLGMTAWDMTQNFGFHTLPDGTLEVYHHGVYFHGYAPPFSLIVRLVFQIHAMWLIYATEIHINERAFTSETEEEEHLEHLSRSNMPAYILFYRLIPEVVYSLTGIKIASHPDNRKSAAEDELAAEKLIRKASAVGFKADAGEEEEEEDEDEDEDEEEEGVAVLASSEAEEEEEAVVETPVALDPAVLALKAELEAAKAELMAAKEEAEQARANIARRSTTNLEDKISLLVEQKIQEKVEAAMAAKQLKRAATRRPTGAWAALQSTNDSTSYEMATRAALQRHQTLKLEKKLTSISEMQNVRRSQSKSGDVVAAAAAKAEFERVMAEKEKEQKQRDVVAAAIKATFEKESQNKIAP